MTKLGDAADMLVGFAFKSSGFLDADADGVKLLRGDNVQQGFIRWGDKTKRWTNADYDDLERYQLAEGDVILAMDRPIVGDGLKMAWIQSEDLPALLVQRVCRLRGKSDIAETDFIRYVLAAPGFSAHIHGITTGANIPHISGKDIAAYEFHLPTIGEQRQIAAVLSNYDSLIATNYCRITMLEEAVRRLYREWFVHLRFPGRETVTMADGMPDGWRRVTLGELADETPGAVVQTGPFGSQLHRHEYKETGVPVVMPQNIVGDRIRMEKIVYVDESTARRLSRHKLQPLDIVFPRRGEIAKRAIVEEHQAGYLCGTGCLKISFPAEPLHPILIYQQLAEPQMVKWIEGQAVGATMLNLSATIMRSVECCIPTSDVQELFVNFATDIRGQIDALEKQIDVLTNARNALLPKLMSGQINVSNISIRNVSEAA